MLRILYINIKSRVQISAAKMLDEEAKSLQLALESGTTGTISNINVRTATFSSPHRHLPHSLTHCLRMTTQGGSTYFRLGSQWTIQIQRRRKLRKRGKYLEVHIKYLHVPKGTSHETPLGVTHYVTQEVHHICTTDSSQERQQNLAGATAKSGEGSAWYTLTLERIKGKDTDT